MYKSTYEALNLLYHKVTKGGYVIIDDYGLKSQACKKAVDDFRNEKVNRLMKLEKLIKDQKINNRLEWI